MQFEGRRPYKVRHFSRFEFFYDTGWTPSSAAPTIFAEAAGPFRVEESPRSGQRKEASVSLGKVQSRSLNPSRSCQIQRRIVAGRLLSDCFLCFDRFSPHHHPLIDVQIYRRAFDGQKRLDFGRQAQSFAAPSRTCRTLRDSAFGVKGFCRKATPSSSTPWRRMASSV
jgi:hypothetical protein